MTLARLDSKLGQFWGRDVLTARSVLCLIIFFSLAAFCADSAIAIGSGNVTLNGKALLQSSAVFPGDVLKTDSNSGIVLQAKGSSFQVGPIAECHLSREGLILDSGTARVSGSGKVQAGGLKIKPATTSANYTVMHTNGEVTVIAVKGSLEVQHGNAVLKLEAGETRSFADSGGAFSAARSGTHTKLAAAIGAAAAASASAVIASHLKGTAARGVSN